MQSEWYSRVRLWQMSNTTPATKQKQLYLNNNKLPALLLGPTETILRFSPLILSNSKKPHKDNIFPGIIDVECVDKDYRY